MSFFGAFAIFAAALALRLLILPVESRLGVLTFYPAAAACFCFFGKWPGRLVVLLSAVTVYYVFTPPHWSWTPSAEGFWSIAVFVVFSEWLGVTVERAKRDHAALHRQKQQFEAIVQDQSEAIYRFRSDGTVLFVNEAFCRMFGVKAEDIVGHHWAPVVYPDDLPQVTERLAMLSPSSPIVTIENRVFGEAGVLRWGQFTNRGFFDEAGALIEIQSVGRDISAGVEARLQLARQSATLTSVTEAIPATVAVVGTDGAYRFVNGAFERQWGTTREHVTGRKVVDVIGQEEFDRRWPWVQMAFAGKPVQFILDYPSRDGTTYIDISYVPLRLDTGEIDGFVVVTNDVTYQKREEVRLRQLSQRDPLTGLLNRAGFETYLDQVIRDGAGDSLALLYIDLDHFKPVNDKHGHPAGDEVLKIFASRLVNLVRPTDAVARLGGDEFAIALSGARERANAHAVAAKVLAAAQAPFHIGPLLIQINASVGVAFDACPDKGWRDLITRADAKLLAAKAAGKGQQRGAE